MQCECWSTNRPKDCNALHTVKEILFRAPCGLNVSDDGDKRKPDLRDRASCLTRGQRVNVGRYVTSRYFHRPKATKSHNYIKGKCFLQTSHCLFSKQQCHSARLPQSHSCTLFQTLKTRLESQKHRTQSV